MPEKPNFQVAHVAIVVPYRPAPMVTVATLLSTASPAPLFGLLGLVFTLIHGGLALVARAKTQKGLSTSPFPETAYGPAGAK